MEETRTINVFFLNLNFMLNKAMEETSSLCEIKSVESLQYDLDTIRAATNNFSEANKLGQGGFGVVYKVYSFTISLDTILFSDVNSILLPMLLFYLNSA